MKLWRNLIIMVAIVAVLIGSIFVVKLIQSKNSDTQNTDSKDITLISKDFDKIDHIAVTSPDGTLNYKTSDESGTWTLETSIEHKFSLNDAQISSNAEILRKIQANKLIEKSATDLDQYGLKTPKYTMVMTLIDGTTEELSLGDTSTTTGKTFALYKGSVYTIYDYVANVIKANIASLEITQNYQIPNENISAIKIERQGKDTIDIESRENNNNIYETRISKLEMKSPYAGCDVNDENLKTMVYDNLNAIAFTSDSEIDSNDYAGYGVTNPAYKITISYVDANAKGTLTKVLSISALKDGYYYAKFDDYEKMYKFSKDTFAFIDNIDPYRAVSQVGFIYNVDVVDHIDVNAKGQTYTFDITHKKVSDDNTEANFKFNGKAVSSDAALTMYQQLIGFYREGLYTGTTDPTGTPDFTMTFTLSNQEKKTISFISINEREYSYTVDGKTQFVIKKSTVEKVISALQTYAKDPSKAVS